MLRCKSMTQERDSREWNAALRLSLQGFHLVKKNYLLAACLLFCQLHYKAVGMSLSPHRLFCYAYCFWTVYSPNFPFLAWKTIVDAVMFSVTTVEATCNRSVCDYCSVNFSFTSMEIFSQTLHYSWKPFGNLILLYM